MLKELTALRDTMSRDLFLMEAYCYFMNNNTPLSDVEAYCEEQGIYPVYDYVLEQRRVMA